MRTIAHISDLHFGTENQEMAGVLIKNLIDLAPALVVISGDITQRARRAEYEAAALWLKQVPFPTLIVPGNHDIPLYDVVRRFAAPLTRYSHYISPDLNPYYCDEKMAVLGINTARSLTWKSGRISKKQVTQIRSKMCESMGDKIKILVTHHPFIPPPGEPEAGIDLVGRASRALAVIDACEVDLLLAGHLHHGYTGDVRSYYPATRRSVIVAQAGTAISRRVRSEPNAYNLITLQSNRISISVQVWQGHDFEPTTPTCYHLFGEEWRREM